MRRPGIVKGTILPATRRPIDNMIVHPNLDLKDLTSRDQNV